MTQPFEANKFGLYNMLGNAWEWTCSAYEKQYQGDEARCAYPTNNASRTIRGGSWYDIPRNVRSANRSNFSPDSKKFTLGFRLVRY